MVNGVEMDMQTQRTLIRFKGAAEPPLIDETVGQRLLKTVARFPDREALVVRHQDVRWTWREYLGRIDRLATGLLALGIEPGDDVQSVTDGEALLDLPHVHPGLVADG